MSAIGSSTAPTRAVLSDAARGDTEVSMVEACAVHGLSAALLDVARDPARVDALYRHIGEHCHQWRNMLNALKLSLHLARRSSAEVERTFWTEVDGRYLQLEAFVEDLQLLCRPIELSRIQVPGTAFLADRLPAWESILARWGARLEPVTPCEDDPIRIDLMRLTRAFDAFVAWRAQAGPGRVELTCSVCEGWLCLDWREAGASRPGAEVVRTENLALPLLVRMIHLHGGDVDLDEDGDGPAFRIRLPLARTAGSA